MREQHEVVFIEGDPPRKQRGWDNFKFALRMRKGAWAVYSEGKTYIDRPSWGADFEVASRTQPDGTYTTYVRCVGSPGAQRALETERDAAEFFLDTEEID